MNKIFACHFVHMFKFFVAYNYGKKSAAPVVLFAGEKKIWLTW